MENVHWTGESLSLARAPGLGLSRQLDISLAVQDPLLLTSLQLTTPATAAALTSVSLASG